jgi:hypothetical protein
MKYQLKTISLNDKLAKGINDLNDVCIYQASLGTAAKITTGFESVESLSIFYETRDFVLQEMVKPDYNNWEGKQDYEERFMDIMKRNSCKFLNPP